MSDDESKGLQMRNGYQDDEEDNIYSTKQDNIGLNKANAFVRKPTRRKQARQGLRISKKLSLTRNNL